MGRALRRALAAAGTLCVIDHSNVDIHMDRIELTLLCAERASDTACLTDFLDSRSLVVGAALYEVVCLVRNKLDQVTRTSLRALTAGNFLLSGTSLNAHNRSDLLAYRSAADRTLINFCFALPICGR